MSHSTRQIRRPALLQPDQNTIHLYPRWPFEQFGAITLIFLVFSIPIFWLAVHPAVITHELYVFFLLLEIPFVILVLVMAGYMLGYKMICITFKRLPDTQQIEIIWDYRIRVVRQRIRYADFLDLIIKSNRLWFI